MLRMVNVKNRHEVVRVVKVVKNKEVLNMKGDGNVGRAKERVRAGIDIS